MLAAFRTDRRCDDLLSARAVSVDNNRQVCDALFFRVFFKIFFWLNCFVVASICYTAVGRIIGASSLLSPDMKALT